MNTEREIFETLLGKLEPTQRMEKFALTFGNLLVVTFQLLEYQYVFD